MCAYLCLCVTDINECFTIMMVCGEGDCLNTEGSYTCICPNGYTTINGGTGCQGTAVIFHMGFMGFMLSKMEKFGNDLITFFQLCCSMTFKDLLFTQFNEADSVLNI